MATYPQQAPAQLAPVDVPVKRPVQDDGTVEEMLTKAAAFMGRDPDEPGTRRLILSGVKSLTDQYPDKSPEDRARIAGQNASKIATMFSRPTDTGVNPRELQQAQGQRQQIADQVNANTRRAEMMAPMMTSVSEAFGNQNARQQYVDQRSAPLREFDAGQAAKQVARLGDIDAVQKDQTARAQAFATQNAGVAAVGVNMDNDPESAVSQAARQGAMAGLKTLGFAPTYAQSLKGMSKAQVDQFMQSSIKTRLDNAKSDADRQQVMALVKQAGAQAKLLDAQARSAGVDASFGERALSGQESGQPLPQKYSGFNSPFTNMRQEAAAKRSSEFEAGSGTRDTTRNAIASSRNLLSEGVKTGFIQGSKIGQIADPKMQMLSKNLAGIAAAAGIDQASSTYQAAQKAASMVDQTKDITTVQKFLNEVDAKMQRDALVNKYRDQAQGANFDEDKVYSRIRTYTLTDPKTKLQSVFTVDLNDPKQAASEKAWLKANAGYFPHLTGSIK